MMIYLQSYDSSIKQMYTTHLLSSGYDLNAVLKVLVALAQIKN